jgi:hypothetical protein
MVDSLNKAADAASRNNDRVALPCGCEVAIPGEVRLPDGMVAAYNEVAPYFADHQKAAVAAVVRHWNEEHASLL